MELIESLKPIFDFLIKYYLFHTILSIVFSLIIARIYYYFFLKKKYRNIRNRTWKWNFKKTNWLWKRKKRT